jgi:threonylcarbamoyladenosine tRNA methylthiotransferase MtaB
MPRVAVHTLGCKVNQYESERIANDFRARGFDVVDFKDCADVYIINTCTVTGVADGKSRQAARGAALRNPEAKIVLTGCYAERSGDEIQGVSLIVGNGAKDRLAEIVCSRLSLNPDANGSSGGSRVPGRTRALLKIQDGCDQFCSYCAVPFARPEMWSKEYPSLMDEARLLRDCGYKEIVLTGIRVGRYSDGEKDLADVLEGLASIDGIERVRLSSIELTDIPRRLMPLMAENRKICRHLHIPLQSGDDETLDRMHRPYTTYDFGAFVDKSRIAVSGLAITTDIMVGFPGETREAFERSRAFCEKMEFARSHVFRYSPRPGTAAEGMSGAVSTEEKERRSSSLIESTRRASEAFAKRLIGERVAVLVEGKEIRPGRRSGLTDNYVRVVFPANEKLIGSIVDVRVVEVVDGVGIGRVEDSDMDRKR